MTRSRCGLGDQYLALESVGVAEEHAVDPAEVVDVPVGCSGVDESLSDGGECLGRGRLKPDVVDAATAPHRCLASSLGVTCDDDDVEFGVWADADDGHRLVAVLAVG